jgi:zinc protease
MLDRKTAPAINPIESIRFEKPMVFDITKENKLFCITSVPDETANFELYFNAGSIHGNTEVASVVNGLLLSGTPEKSPIQINDELDGLGAYLSQNISLENAVITVHALRENILPIARIIRDAVQHCEFNEKEFNQNIQTRRQKLSINLEKVNILAQRAFKQRFFNGSEKYSSVTTDEDLQNIKREELIDFHQKRYLKGLTKMVLVGNFTQNEIDAFIDIFGSWVNDEKPTFENQFDSIKGYAHIEKEGALQTAIRVGRPLFNKKHEDYPDFIILNTLVGDYFGSRLMKNIREDKGYTYGIGSMIAELEETGYFIIGTEVGKEVKDLALAEIKYELDKLKTKLVEQEELDLVKNYLLGQLLKSADGPYSMMDLYLSVEMFGMDLEFYNKMIHHINTITPERIKELANKYFNWEEFTIVTAG